MKSPIDDLRETLDEARLYHDIWWIIVGDHDQQPNIVTLGTRYYLSVSMITSSLFVSFITKFSSAFDSRGDSISLKILPDHADHPQFSEIWTRGKTLYTFRNKVIAHRDLEVTERNFALETGFTYNDLRKILDEASSIFDFCADRMSIERTRRFSCVPNFQRMVEDLAGLLRAEQGAAANP